MTHEVWFPLQVTVGHLLENGANKPPLNPITQVEAPATKVAGKRKVEYQSLKPDIRRSICQHVQLAEGDLY